MKTKKRLTLLGSTGSIGDSTLDVVGRRLDFHELEGMVLMTVPRTVLRRSDQIRKRVFDAVGSAAALAALAPLFLLCAISTETAKNIAVNRRSPTGRYLKNGNPAA